MLFSIDEEGAVEAIEKSTLFELALVERDDLQEWVLDEPRILGEDLLVITSEYAGFEGTLDRLDVLALDRHGTLVVTELKRDRGVLQEGDELLFNEALFEKDWMPDDVEDKWDPDDAFWQAVVTETNSRTNYVRWQHDDTEHSFTSLTRAVLQELYDEDDPYFNDTFAYWTHPAYGYETLTALREDGAPDRSERG